MRRNGMLPLNSLVIWSVLFQRPALHTFCFEEDELVFGDTYTGQKHLAVYN